MGACMSSNRVDAFDALDAIHVLDVKYNTLFDVNERDVEDMINQIREEIELESYVGILRLPCAPTKKVKV